MEARALAGTLTQRVLGAARRAGAALLAAAVVAAFALPSSAAGTARVSISIGINGVEGVSALDAQTGASPGEINLTWTEPMHVGATPPFTYDMRVSTVANIDSDAQMLAAQPLTAFSGSPLPTPGAGGGTAGAVITGLTPGVVHFFALRELDSLGVYGAWTRANGKNPTNFAASNTSVPAPITDLTGLPGPADGQVSLTWTAPVPAGTTSYRVFYATFPVSSVGGSTTAWRAAALSSSTLVSPTVPSGGTQPAVLALNPGVKWYFGVEATNASGTGSLDLNASGLQVNVRSRGVAPVTDLAAASGPSSTGITLSWTEPFVSSTTAPVVYEIRVTTSVFIDGATGYAAAANLTSVATVTYPAYGGGGGLASVEATGLIPFTTYYFAVRVVDGSTPTLAGVWLRDTTQGRNVNTSAVPLFAPTAPDAVTDLTSLPGAGEGDVTLVWTAPSNANLTGAVSYEVRFATVSAASMGSTTTWFAAASSQAFAAALPPGSLETRSLTGLFPAATWYFAVKSVGLGGVLSPIDVKSTGAFQASTLPTSLPPSTPSGLSAVGGLRRATVSWTDLSAAGKGLDFAHYRLERSTDLVTFVPVTTTTATGYSEFPLPAKVTDYYRLVARDLRGNESAASAIVSALPYTIVPMEPLGVTVAATPTDVTLTWSPTVRYGDGTPFVSTAAPVADELIGYTIWRATESCGPFVYVHVASLPVVTTNLLNPTGGLAYFYHVQSYNTEGVSTNTVTISSLGERKFFLDDCDSQLTMSAVDSALLNAATNGLGADVRILASRRPQDVGGPIFQSAEWRAYLNGVSEMQGFTLPKPARFTLHFDAVGGSVVPTTAPYYGQSVAAAAGPAPAAADMKNLGMYWYNGGEFKKMYGTVDTLSQTVTVESPNLGIYQIRSLFRADGAVFDLSNVSNRVITPNGDGLNDVVIFTYDPGPNNASVRGRIYDMTGAFVADMTPGLVPNTLTWDGKMGGRAVNGGVYVYKIEGDGKTYTGTVVVAR